MNDRFAWGVRFLFSFAVLGFFWGFLLLRTFTDLNLLQFASLWFVTALNATALSMIWLL